MYEQIKQIQVRTAIYALFGNRLSRVPGTQRPKTKVRNLTAEVIFDDNVRHKDVPHTVDSVIICSSQPFLCLRTTLRSSRARQLGEATADSQFCY